MSEKVGRNDPCPCGSGKKYKKCCELTTGSKRKLQATVISSGTPLQDKAAKISTNFFSKPAQEVPPLPKIGKKEDEPKHPPEADRPM